MADRTRIADALARLRKHQRDDAALKLAAALHRSQQADAELRQGETRLAGLEQEHAERNGSGRPLDPILLEQSGRAIAGSRLQIRQAQAKQQQCAAESEQARNAAGQAQCRHKVAENWRSDVFDARETEREARDFTASLEAQNGRHHDGGHGGAA